MDLIYFAFAAYLTIGFFDQISSEAEPTAHRAECLLVDSILSPPRIATVICLGFVLQIHVQGTCEAIYISLRAQTAHVPKLYT